MITDEQIRCAWDATKSGEQPLYDGLPHITRGILRRRAENALASGKSGGGSFDAFDQYLIGESVIDEQGEIPLPVEVVEELIAEEEPFEPPPKAEDYASDLEVELFPVEPVVDEPVVEKPKRKSPVKKTAKKLAEVKKVERKPVLVKKTTKAAPKATKKATKK